MNICVWYSPAKEGIMWDDIEDHGGIDRISPQGPFETVAEAVADAEQIEFVDQVRDRQPDHYPAEVT